MDPITSGALISAAAPIVGGLFGEKSEDPTPGLAAQVVYNRIAKRADRSDQFRHDRKVGKKQYQRLVEAAQKGGFNPMTVLGTASRAGQSSVPGVLPSAGGGTSFSVGDAIERSMMNFGDFWAGSEQRKLTAAQADLAEARAATLRDEMAKRDTLTDQATNNQVRDVSKDPKLTVYDAEYWKNFDGAHKEQGKRSFPVYSPLGKLFFIFPDQARRMRLQPYDTFVADETTAHIGDVHGEIDNLVAGPWVTTRTGRDPRAPDPYQEYEQRTVPKSNVPTGYSGFHFSE